DRVPPRWPALDHGRIRAPGRRVGCHVGPTPRCGSVAPTGGPGADSRVLAGWALAGEPGSQWSTAALAGRDARPPPRAVRRADGQLHRWMDHLQPGWFPAGGRDEQLAPQGAIRAARLGSREWTPASYLSTGVALRLGRLLPRRCRFARGRFGRIALLA